MTDAFSSVSNDRPPHGRGRRLGRWIVARLPLADEIAIGCIAAAVALVPIHVVAIAVAVPMPPSGVATRVGHHLFDLVHVVGFGALVGLVPAALVGAFGARRRGALGAWVIFTAVAMAATYGLLAEHLQREANVVWGGRAAFWLFPLYVVLCGLGVTAAHLVGAVLGRIPRWRLVPFFAGLSVATAHHLFLRDDYPGVHAALEWVSVVLVSGVLGPLLARRLLRQAGRDGPLDPRGARASGQLLVPRADARTTPWGKAPEVRVALAAGLLALGPWLVPPGNAVRLELFREPGAVGAHVLSLLAWRSPDIPFGPSSEQPRPVYVPQPRPADRALGARARRRGPPVVVLITVEAFRADVLASRDHDAELPVLRKLRDESAYFPRAVAAGSQTSVSLTTLFSGRYFSQLTWALHGSGAQRFLYAADDPIVRFPQLLTEAHVPTESHLGLVFLASEFGMARGFAHEDRVVKDRRHALAREVLSPLLRSLRRPNRKGLFVYAHLTEPHEPYDRGKKRDGTDFERYVSEIAVVDGWLGKIRRLLQTNAPGRGYLIVTGDHGEAFGEHGTKFHTKTLYDEMVRVPLLIWGPGIVAHEHDELASLIDVGPTILELYGLPTPPWHMGQSLWPLASGQGSPLERPVLAEGRLRRAYFAPDGIKVIEDHRRKTVEAYDLVSDPTEAHNLFDVDPERVSAALSKLRAFFARYERRYAGYRPPFKR